jgi:hypothetical protein
MFIDPRVGFILIGAILSQGCRGKTEDASALQPQDAAAEVESGSPEDASPPAACELLEGRCVGNCCSPVEGYPIDRDRQCFGPKVLLVCRPITDPYRCVDSAAVACLQRPATDGGLEVFATPVGYNGYDAGTLTRCSSEVRAEALNAKPCP